MDIPDVKAKRIILGVWPLGQYLMNQGGSAHSLIVVTTALPIASTLSPKLERSKFMEGPERIPMCRLTKAKIRKTAATDQPPEAKV